MKRSCSATTKRDITSYFLLLDVPERNKFNDKGLVSLHHNSEDYSDTYNTPPISCRLHAIYHFDILAR